jgi:VanZ family protein
MRRPWLPVVLWVLVIEGLMIWPHPPAAPQLINFPGIDKVVHLGLFGTLAALSARALGGTPRTWWPALLGAMLFGAFTEFEQSFIPSRSMDLGDFLADSAGAAIGLAMFAAWALRRRELRR